MMREHLTLHANLVMFKTNSSSSFFDAAEMKHDFHSFLKKIIFWLPLVTGWRTRGKKLFRRAVPYSRLLTLTLMLMLSLNFCSSNQKKPRLIRRLAQTMKPKL